MHLIRECYLCNAVDVLINPDIITICKLNLVIAYIKLFSRGASPVDMTIVINKLDLECILFLSNKVHWRIGDVNLSSTIVLLGINLLTSFWVNLNWGWFVFLFLNLFLLNLFLICFFFWLFWFFRLLLLDNDRLCYRRYLSIFWENICNASTLFIEPHEYQTSECDNCYE